MTELWRKETHYFVVEIQVGHAWVIHCKESLLSAAEREAQIMARDSSVLGVRVLEHDIRHICSLHSEVTCEPVVKLPPKMKHTGEDSFCPRCKSDAPVASDGDTEWIFCARCGTAFPN